MTFQVWVLDSTPGKVRAGADGDDHPAELISFLSTLPKEVSMCSFADTLEFFSSFPSPFTFPWAFYCETYTLAHFGIVKIGLFNLFSILNASQHCLSWVILLRIPWISIWQSFTDTQLNFFLKIVFQGRSLPNRMLWILFFSMGSQKMCRK